MKKKYNNYDLTNEYGIGYTSKGEEFYFDLEDYDKIKDYCWSSDKDGYLTAYDFIKKNNIKIKMHNLIIVPNKGEIIDHINRNPKDNRKANLRICTSTQNSFNRKRCDCKDKVMGVRWRKDREKWTARLTERGKTHNLGCFDNIENAIKARLEAEAKYFGNFSPQIDLFDKYGVNLNE